MHDMGWERGKTVAVETEGLEPGQILQLSRQLVQNVVI